jgi:prephenate dehydratase
MDKKIKKVFRKSAFFYEIFVMDMRNSFFVLFVVVLKVFMKKKIGIITKESRKIRTNCKNYNFYMHSRL